MRALVVFAGVAEHVGEDDDILDLAQFGKFFFDKGARADVLQSNGVEHARRGFVQTRRRIAGHRFRGESLDHEAAEFVEVHDIFELNPVAKGPAGGNHRILQLDAGEANAEIRTGSGDGSGHRGPLAMVEPARGPSAPLKSRPSTVGMPRSSVP